DRPGRRVRASHVREAVAQRPTRACPPSPERRADPHRWPRHHDPRRSRRRLAEPIASVGRTRGVFGLDDWIAGLSDGASFGVVLLVAALLGLRHATHPDHIAAMTTLVASGRGRGARSAAELGAWWGIGHGITLVVFGIPVLLAERYLPERLQQGAGTAVPVLIVFLAV